LVEDGFWVAFHEPGCHEEEAYVPLLPDGALFRINFNLFQIFDDASVYKLDMLDKSIDPLPLVETIIADLNAHAQGLVSIGMQSPTSPVTHIKLILAIDQHL
jgi:hypothetical protein